MWVANSLGGTVSRIDPETNRPEATIGIGGGPAGRHGRARSGLGHGPGERGGPRRARARGRRGHRAGRAARPRRVCRQRLFRDCLRDLRAACITTPIVPFPEGSQLVSEVAAGEPLVSDDGRTYRFRIRPGFRFSPSSNEPVTAAAFERTLERALAPDVASSVVLPIVGADDYTAGRARTLKGVEARNGTLVIRLTRPLPDLPVRLSSNTFCAVPPDTPLEEPAESVASAGPYYIASYVPERSVVLRRNPNYGGERPQGLEEIRIDFGIPVERGVEEVEDGRADYVPLRPGEGDTAGLGAGVGTARGDLWPRERGCAGRPPAAVHAETWPPWTPSSSTPGPRPVRRPAPAPGGELRDQSPRSSP